MKKRLSFILCLLACILLAGCAHGRKISAREALEEALVRSGPKNGSIPPEEHSGQPSPAENKEQVPENAETGYSYSRKRPYILFPERKQIVEPVAPPEENLVPVIPVTPAVPEIPQETFGTEETASLAKKDIPDKTETIEKPEAAKKAPAIPPETISPLDRWNGECLVYQITWNSIRFAKGLLACRKTRNAYGEVFHIVGLSVPEERMSGIGMALYRMDAFIDTKTLLPYYYYQYRKIKEKEDILDIRFEWKNRSYVSKYRKFKSGKIYSTKENTVKLPDAAYDAISIFYVIRTLNLEKPICLNIPIALRDLWELSIQIVGKRTQNVLNMGKKEVYVLRPQAQSDEGFFTKGAMDLWITADQKMIPVYLEGKVSFGKARMSLISETRLAPETTFSAETIADILSRFN